MVKDNADDDYDDDGVDDDDDDDDEILFCWHMPRSTSSLHACDPLTLCINHMSQCKHFQHYYNSRHLHVDQLHYNAI